MESTPSARLSRALDSLEGLSVGDAFGEGFFMSFELAVSLMESGEFGQPPFDFENDEALQALIETRRTEFIARPWRWTDDTALALEIVANLREFDSIEPESLAKAFSRRYSSDPVRGYGGAMHSLLPALRFGEWEKFAPSLFGGTGSFGNGAAMRAAPLGAYFADDPDRCAREAALSSQITHAHPEGIAGGIAVAMAACFAARRRADDDDGDILKPVLPYVALGRVRDALERAHTLEFATPQEAAENLGSGHEIAAHDTVAFCLWCAARNLDDFEEAMWETVSGLGDRDTTCAIVGGIVGARVGTDGVPAQWRQSREKLGNF